MTSDLTLSFAAGELRRLDRERFTTALFAPSERREAVMALYAFNAEVARVKDAVAEPMAGMIRLQWWREALAGERPGETATHPVAAPLMAACRVAKVSGEVFERLLEARERELDTPIPAGLHDLEAHASDTSGGLTRLALELLGARDEVTLAAGHSVGTAYALVGMLRAEPFALAAGRSSLPADSLARAGTSAESLLAGKAPRPAIAQAARTVADRARELLAEARTRRIDRRGIAALLPGTLAAAHLRVLAKAGHDVFDPRVARPRPMPVRLALNALVGRF